MPFSQRRKRRPESPETTHDEDMDENRRAPKRRRKTAATAAAAPKKKKIVRRRRGASSAMDIVSIPGSERYYAQYRDALNEMSHADARMATAAARRPNYMSTITMMSMPASYYPSQQHATTAPASSTTRAPTITPTPPSTAVATVAAAPPSTAVATVAAAPPAKPVATVAAAPPAKTAVVAKTVNLSISATTPVGVKLLVAKDPPLASLKSALVESTGPFPGRRAALTLSNLYCRNILGLRGVNDVSHYALNSNQKIMLIGLPYTITNLPDVDKMLYPAIHRWLKEVYLNAPGCLYILNTFYKVYGFTTPIGTVRTETAAPNIVEPLKVGSVPAKLIAKLFGDCYAGCFGSTGMHHFYEGMNVESSINQAHIDQSSLSIFRQYGPDWRTATVDVSGHFDMISTMLVSIGSGGRKIPRIPLKPGEWDAFLKEVHAGNMTNFDSAACNKTMGMFVAFIDQIIRAMIIQKISWIDSLTEVLKITIDSLFNRDPQNAYFLSDLSKFMISLTTAYTMQLILSKQPACPNVICIVPVRDMGSYDRIIRLITAGAKPVKTDRISPDDLVLISDTEWDFFEAKNTLSTVNPTVPSTRKTPRAPYPNPATSTSAGAGAPASAGAIPLPPPLPVAAATPASAGAIPLPPPLPAAAAATAATGAPTSLLAAITAGKPLKKAPSGTDPGAGPTAKPVSVLDAIKTGITLKKVGPTPAGAALAKKASGGMAGALANAIGNRRTAMETSPIEDAEDAVTAAEAASAADPTNTTLTAAVAAAKATLAALEKEEADSWS